MSYKISTQLLFLIFVSMLSLVCWLLGCLYCFWSLWLVFLCSFSCSFWVVVLIHQRYLQCFGDLFLSLFLKHIVMYIISGCKALRVVIYFLVIWAIYLVSFIIHGPEYLTKEATVVFFLLIRFLWYSFVLSSFIIFLR